MKPKFSQFLDQASNFLEKRKGLLPLAGASLILLNFMFSLFMDNWLVQTDFFLHLGVILAILGFLLAWAL